MFTEPNEHHLWLQRLIGTWSFTNATDQAKGVQPGVETVTAYGDLWIVGDGESPIPDQEDVMHMRMTLGYDPERQQYVGTWIGSPMSVLYVYAGTREGDVLTLDTEGPSMDDPTKTAAYQDIIELNNDGSRTLRSQVRTDDGSWTEFNHVTYTRV